VENPRLIRTGNRIINPDHIASAEKDADGDVVVTFPDGSRMVFSGAQASSLWHTLDGEACKVTIP
jgi:hypothetical protein